MMHPYAMAEWANLFRYKPHYKAIRGGRQIMIVGIDTFDTRLDLINWDAFRRWNGATVNLDLSLSGGEVKFAGRNFTVGNNMWAHAESTDAMKAPKPTNIGLLNLAVPLVAPIQAPISVHQQSKLARGFLHGKLDASATCHKIRQSWLAGEFRFPTSGRINVFLALDYDVPLSIEYWAGWASTVNAYLIAEGDVVIGPAAPMVQPFCAGLVCRYVASGNKLQLDPQVGVLLLAGGIPGIDTKCYAIWADAPDPDPDGVRPNPQLDWTRFDPAQTPDIWRFSKSFRNADGSPAEESFSLDVVREPAEQFELKATDSMLIPQKWQPNVPQIGRRGYVDLPLNQHNEIRPLTNQEIADTAAHPFPDLSDIAATFTISKGPVETVGRYLKTPGRGLSLSRDEAERISKANLNIFTVWESFNVAANGEPTMNDPGTSNPNPIKKGIEYFNPTHHAGSEDGSNAFSQCVANLRQPPHTPVYFCVDFDAADPHDTAPVSGTDAQKWIEGYLSLIKDERDKYVQQFPGRYYTIGLYSNGGVAGWAYKQGIVSEFWQSVGAGSTGNNAPYRPWFHANRWQFNREKGLSPKWAFVEGADPDADWYDGGTWTLSDPLSQELEEVENQEAHAFIKRFIPIIQGLLP
jgi:hypothetical protein